MNTSLKHFQKIVIQLIAVLLLMVGNVAEAQFPYYFSAAGTSVSSKTIVRHYTEAFTVVYFEENGTGYVSLVNVLTNNAITVPLDDGVFMNDMCIMNDSAFLCGYYAMPSENIGCIVTMNLNNFFTNSVHVTYFLPSYWLNTIYTHIAGYEYTYGLNNSTYAKFLMVGDIEYSCDGSSTFPINGLPHTDDYIDPDNHSTCTVNAVVEVGYPFQAGNTYSYTSQKVFRFINPSVHSEVIHDVVETDNYVAFVGVASGSSDSITLHVCNKGYNVLWTNFSTILSDFDNYYTYSLGTSSGNPFYHACALDGDMIAIATQDETSTSSNEITIRTINLATHTMTNTQYLQCNSHPELKDITYIPHVQNVQRVILLYNSYFQPAGSNCEIFCRIDPYNSYNYYEPGIAENAFQLKYGSLDAMVGDFFISTGGKYGFVFDASTFGPYGRCYDTEDYYIVCRPSINSGTSTFDYDPHRASALIWYVDSSPVQTALPSQCMIIGTKE